MLNALAENGTFQTHGNNHQPTAETETFIFVVSNQSY